ncbi:MAG: CPBP family intramembrane metalloprotease [Micropruina sp.]|nr:CPBP family intramembrane metalloprotease [Micropruina sp.]
MNQERGAVDWRPVAFFYAIAFGGAVLVALLIWTLRQWGGGVGAALGLVLTAVLYMPLPMVAGLITERIFVRRYLLGQEWRALRSSFWRHYGRSALVTVAITAAILALGFAVAWLAGTMAVPGAGHLVTTDAEFRDQVGRVSPGVDLNVLPPLAVLVPVTLVQGVLAGLTINGLFAFGEEYGWRGVLDRLLRPLGRVRACLLTGVLWGLWHAPIIVLGHNYGAQWQWGIPVMVTWTVPFSFLLTWAKDRAGTVLAPAMLHGAFNGVAGLFTLVVVGGSVLIALPVGLLMAMTLTLLAILVWHLPAHGEVTANP